MMISSLPEQGAGLRGTAKNSRRKEFGRPPLDAQSGDLKNHP